MKIILKSLMSFILLACASQAFAQQPPGPLPVYWTYNGQRLPADGIVSAPEGKYIEARRITDSALLYRAWTYMNNGYNVFAGQGHYTTSPTAVRDQGVLIKNPGGGQGASHQLYYADGTIYTAIIPHWFATFQSHRFNTVPGKDMVAWSSQNSLYGGNIWNAEDVLHLLGGKPGLIVKQYRLPSYQWFLGTSPRISWAWKVEQINLGNHDAFNVYFTGPNPNRLPATTPNGILRVDFYNNTYTWIQ